MERRRDGEMEGRRDGEMERWRDGVGERENAGNEDVNKGGMINDALQLHKMPVQTTISL
jgi:hypothetical protein